MIRVLVALVNRIARIAACEALVLLARSARWFGWRRAAGWLYGAALRVEES